MANGIDIFFDSDGPLLKGSYGLKVLLPLNRRNDHGMAVPRTMVEDGSFKKIECPVGQIHSSDVKYIEKLLSE